MRLRVIIIPTVVVSALGFVSSATGAPQEVPESSQVRSILREASALIPRIDSNQRSSAAANIAGQQVRAGDLEGGLATYQALKNPSDRGMAVAAIASAIASQGNMPMALELTRNSAQPGFRASAYSMIASGLASKNNFEEALAVAWLIRKEPGQAHIFVDSLMWIYVRQWKAGDEPGAESTLNEALDAVEQGKEDEGRTDFMTASMYYTIMSRLNEAGNRDAASAMVERIYGIAASAENPDRKQELLGLLTWAQISAGRLQEAINSAEELPPGQWRDSAMEVISMERTRQGDAAGALEAVVEIGGDVLRNICYRTVADGFAGSGNYSQALATIDRIQGAGERAYGLAELALQQAEKNDPAATQTVELAQEAALNAGDATKPYVFEFVAVTRAMLGDLAGAEEMISRMDDPAKVWPLWNLTEMLVHAGRETEAISLAESETAPHPRAYALLGTATALLDKQREASHSAGDPTK